MPNDNIDGKAWHDELYDAHLNWQERVDNAMCEMAVKEFVACKDCLHPYECKEELTCKLHKFKELERCKGCTQQQCLVELECMFNH
jgi:hypothetical protein